MNPYVQEESRDEDVTLGIVVWTTLYLATRDRQGASENTTFRSMKDQAKTVRHMALVQAWPIRWELPELDASGSGPATERITNIENVTHVDLESEFHRWVLKNHLNHLIFKTAQT